MIKPPALLSQRQLKTAIKTLWNEGSVTVLPHARKRMGTRHMTFQDIHHILWYGRLVDHSIPEGVWRYKIQGQTLNNQKGSCVVEIQETLIIVTVID
jgi:hypothetical protein